MKPIPERAVFFDFDGTITIRDTFVEAIRQHAPKVTDEVLPLFAQGQITLRDGIKRILSSIESKHLPSMIEFVAAVPRRAGLEELLDFLDEHDSLAVVVSSGLSRFVRANLGPLVDRFSDIHAGELRDSPMLEVWSPFESDHELVAKADVLRQLGASQNVVIGDSITDRRIAQEADVVFARDHLVKYCRLDRVPFHDWVDFHDVRRVLESLWS